MKTIFYSGNFGQPCVAEYGIALSYNETATRADIVVVNSPRIGFGTNLWTGDESRISVLNTILSRELRGIRTEFIRFFVLLEDETTMMGMELPIRLDVHDYAEKGNPHGWRRVPPTTLRAKLVQWIGIRQRAVSFDTIHVVAGCARFYTDFEERRNLPPEELRMLCAAVGYQPMKMVA
jgi:hypothetical protein